MPLQKIYKLFNCLWLQLWKFWIANLYIYLLVATPSAGCAQGSLWLVGGIALAATISFWRFLTFSEFFLYNFWEIVVFTIFLTFFLIDCYCSWLLLLLFWVCFSPSEVLFWGVNRNGDDHVNVSFLPCIEMKFSELVCISLAHNFSSVYDRSYVISVAKWRWWWEWIRHTISFMRVLTNDFFFLPQVRKAYFCNSNDRASDKDKFLCSVILLFFFHEWIWKFSAY